MRRAALAADQGPTDEQQATRWPFGALMEELGDPQDPTNVTFPFLRRMRRDHIVSMGLHFIAMPIVKAPWYYEADDARAAAMADNILRPIYGDLILTILRFLWAGYSPAAKNYDVVSPTWSYNDIDGNSKPVWDNGNIGAVIYKPVTQLRPENALPVYNNGKFNGITYDGRYGGIGYFLVSGQRKPSIDLLHSVWAVHDKANEDGSPFGFPRIAHCAPIFHMYRYIWTLLGRAFENNADPGPVMRYPREEANTLDGEGNSISTVQVALRMGRRRRSGSTIALPSDTYRDFQDKPTGVKLWDIEYPKADISFDSIQNFLGFLEAAKLRALWLQEQGLIDATSGSTSNRNVASEFGQQRDASQNVLMNQIDTFIDEVFMRPIMAMNMPTYEGKLVKKTLGFGADDEDIVRQVFQLMGQKEDGFARFGIDVRRLAEARGFPMMDPAEQRKLLDVAAKQASKGGPPPVTPDQGRRALVTQTGFGDFVYNQLPGTLSLADIAARGVDDGDFVASLPRVDAFSDTGVIDATRDLRSRMVSFLAWSYADIARHLGKQKTLDLDEELADSTAEEIAERLVLSWNVDLSLIEGLLGGVRKSMSKIFNSAAGVQCLKLGHRADEPTDVLDQWCVTSVSGAITALRDQAMTMLVDVIAERASYSELAAAVRARSEGLPAARAAAMAVDEAINVYNLAVVEVGREAGLAAAQIVDADSDRHGEIVALSQISPADLESGSLSIRLLTKAAHGVDVRSEELDGGLLARFDADSDTILLSPEIDRAERSKYLLAVGERLA
jgi:hypothetical protein